LRSALLADLAHASAVFSGVLGIAGLAVRAWIAWAEAQRAVVGVDGRVPLGELVERFVLTAARAALGLWHCWHYHHVAGGEPCGAEAAPHQSCEARLLYVVTARRPRYQGEVLMANKAYRVRVLRRCIAYEEDTVITVAARTADRAGRRAREQAQKGSLEWQKVVGVKPRLTRPIVIACEQIEEAS